MDKFNNNSNEIKIGMLLGKIGHMHAIRADQFTSHIGLYRGQAILLKILSEQDGLTHTEIAEKLGISPAAATKVIKRMEVLHYLQRRTDPTDERVSRVFLEEGGRAVDWQIRNAFAQIDQILLNNLSPEEQNTLIDLLLKVYDSLVENLSDAESYTFPRINLP